VISVARSSRAESSGCAADSAIRDRAASNSSGREREAGDVSWTTTCSGHAFVDLAAAGGVPASSRSRNQRKELTRLACERRVPLRRERRHLGEASHGFAVMLRRQPDVTLAPHAARVDAGAPKMRRELQGFRREKYCHHGAWTLSTITPAQPKASRRAARGGP
jgi:hypothetical protein